jgi:anthranilate phosphoribosyltransferase
MLLVLEGKADPVQAAIFLIALRMKRETDDENLGILDAIQGRTCTTKVPVPELVDIADPYNGYLRTLPATPFLPAVLAACGLPAFCHGVESVAPKHGLTARMILRAAEAPTNLVPDQAGEQVSHPAIGWCYLDQASFCPELHELSALRDLMIKRTCISTLETLAAPLRAGRKTHLVTGFVHKAYPRIYAMAARQAGFYSALILRGTEGGVVPPLKQSVTCFRYTDGGAEAPFKADPSKLGVGRKNRAVTCPPIMTESANLDCLATAAAKLGLEALNGAPGAMRDCLVYTGALVLWHTGRSASIQAGAMDLRAVLDNGKALKRFRAAN